LHQARALVARELPVFQHHDQIGVADGGQEVRYHEGGPVLHQHVQRGALQRQGQFLAAGVGAGQADVAIECVVEQVGVLRHQRQAFAQTVEPKLEQVHAIDAHAALAGVPEAQHPPVSLRN